MSSTLNVITFNVRGLGHPIKRKRVLTFLKKEKVDIAFLQETHLSKEEHKKLKRDWVRQVYFSSFTSNKRGTAILIHKRIPFIFKEQYRDLGGRQILIKGMLYGQELTLLNVYAPNEDNPKFMMDIISLFNQYNTDFGIVAGDFNCHMDSNLDKSSTTLSNPNASKTLRLASADIGLVDVWRELNPTRKDYTFYSARHKSYSRLDLFFLPQDHLSSIVSCDIGPILISDHSPVYLRLSLPQQTNQNKQWRFNASLLTDREACKNVRKWLEQYRQDNVSSPVTPAVMWDAAKAVIRGQLISYASAKKKSITKQAEQFKKELIDLEQCHKQSPTEENLRKLYAARTNLNLIQTEHIKKLLFFTKQKYHEYGNKLSKFLAYQLKKERAESTIKCTRNEAGQLKYDTQSIKSSFLDFYTQLYASENPFATDIHRFLEKISLLSISEDEKEQLSAPFTPEEVLQAIKSMPSGKTPGLDGYSVEFYKAFWVQIEPLFMPMVTDFFENGVLPDTMKTAIISLIHKKDKDAAECASYHPISLLPVDFKILSKLIAHRLEDLLPQIINPDQSGFMKARYASDNIRRLLNIIDHSSLHNRTALLLSLDAEKAFDRVEWSYLFAVLEKFNLGEKCIRWVRTMYSNPQAQICINGTLTEKFDLFRGCRQGCPLSPFLFNLAIEPLAEAIQANEEIAGINIGKTQNKISLYADDIILYLTSPEQSIPAILDLITKFGTISGYKINLTKSIALLINSSVSNRLKAISPFTWAQSSFKYLGVNVALKLKDLYLINYIPLLKKIKEELEHWKLLPISFLGRTNVIKMNVLPRFSYLFQSLPCYLDKTFFKSVNKMLTSFIWKNSSPRIAFKTLTKSREKGGLAIPDLQRYYWAAQTKNIISWVQRRNSAVWIDIEEELCTPISTTLLPFINNIKVLHQITKTYVVYNTLRAWQDTNKFCGNFGKISRLSPLSLNPDLPSSIGGSLFAEWRSNGIYQLQQLFDGDMLKSFAVLMSEYEIPKRDFYKYLQIRHLINTLKGEKCLSLGLTNLEEILVKSTSLKGKISEIYSTLLDHYSSSLTPLRNIWQKDMGCAFDDDQWDTICQNVFSSLSCNKIIEQNYKFMHRMYLTPLRLSKMFPNSSPRCHRCKTCKGSIMHVFWECRKLKHFWKAVHDLTVKIVETPLDITPTLYLFGTELDKTLDTTCRKRIILMSYIAKKCILLNWKQQRPPSFNLFKQILNETSRLEQRTYVLKNKWDAFRKIWEPLMDL